jgi:hypothetical protein
VDQQGVAVARRLDRHLCADDATGPASVVDDDFAAGNLRQLGTHDAGDDVDGAASRERHDQADGSLRIGLRIRRRHAGERKS